MDLKNTRKDTKVVYSEKCPQTGAHVYPIYQSSTFVFDNADQGARRFAQQEDGYIYTRLGNPTTRELEKKLALLENGEDCLAFGSGMAAVTACIMGFVKTGDHIVSQHSIYACTQAFFTETLSKYGVEITYVDACNVEEVEAAMKENTKIVYVETPSNPTMSIVDIKEMSRIAKKFNARLVVDNTFLSPYLQRPIELGADLVVHSATKYIGGHGDVIAGALIGNNEDIDLIRWTTQKNIGGVLGPFESWLLLRGLKTLGVRMEQHEKNAMKVAKYLEAHEKVETVYYPGLKSHRHHEIAKAQADGFGGMMTFELKGGLEAGKTLMNEVKIIKLAVSLGTTDSLIQHPASMTHGTVPPEERLEEGITDGLIRFSVGIENADDIIAELERGLSKI